MRHIVKTGLILMLVLALFIPQLAFAGEIVEDPTIKLSQVQQQNTQVTMYVSMPDDGTPASAYTADKFYVSVDDHALPADSVEAFDANAVGTHYVFSIDVSLSVKKEMMASVRDAMHLFVDNLGPKDSVSIITFGEKITSLVQNSSDKEALHGIIDGIVPSENYTALYKGVIDGVVIADRAGGRSAIIVITDGENDPIGEMTEYTMDSIYDQVSKSQVPLYCIGLLGTNGKNGVDTESLKQLAQVTGGAQFLISAENTSETLGDIRDTTRNALVIRATLVNLDGKDSFSATSTFIVGYQSPQDFITSNELKQNINWKSVPVLVATPTPEPYVTPEISLILDDEEIVYIEGEKVVISGAIIIEQGSVSAEDLLLHVNDEPWRMAEINVNGSSSYTFKAEGIIDSSVTRLDVKAEVDGTEDTVVSRNHRIDVVRPTATVLSVELDNTGRDIMYIPGEVHTISGVINVQGTVDQESLELYVNDSPCEVSIVWINSSQYEFSADYVMPDVYPEELSIQVRLNGTDIYSRAQRLFLVTPSPTPDPEIYFSLSDVSVMNADGMPVEIHGNIEIMSGEVSAEDLVLYVNNVKWDMEIDALSDGTFGFTASNLTDMDVTKLDVKIRLKSNTRVVSNSETLTVTTPEPTPTVAPTPRPVATPPPMIATATPAAHGNTAEPEGTAAPGSNGTGGLGMLGGSGAGADTAAEAVASAAPDDLIGKVKFVINDMVAKGTIWYVVAGLVLLLIIIVIIIAIVHKRKSKIQPIPTPSSFVTDHSEEQSKTMRSMEGTPTVRQDSMNGDGVGFHGGVNHNSSGTVHIDNGSSGTMHIDNKDELGGGTVRIDTYNDYDENESGGTQRLDAVPHVDITIEEMRGGKQLESRSISIDSESEVVLGRSTAADVVIADTAVSVKNTSITYDGENVFVIDLASTNGTKLNGVKLDPRQPTQIKSGDTVIVGKTTLTFTFDTAGTY